MVYRHLNLGANLHVGIYQGIQSLYPPAAHRVLNRRQPQIAVTLADLFEDARDISHGLILDALSELQHRGGVTKAALRTKIPYPQRPLQDERPAHQLPPNCHKALVRQRTFIRLRDPLENLLLTVRGINGSGSL